MGVGVYLMIFVVSLAIAWFTILFSAHKGFFLDDHDSSKPQRFHHATTPRAGGLAIFLASLAVVWLIPWGWAFMLASSLAFASGIVEDFKGTLTPKVRLFIQLSAALAGVWLVDALILDIGIDWILPWGLGLVFTLFAVVGAINSINIIDGFNGLASGVAMMVLFSLALAAHSVGDGEILCLSLSVLAATLGFFVLNFPKGKIFLGDGGAYFLGFVIVEIAIMLSQKHEEISPWFVLGVMIYPVYEVLFSVYRRRLVRGLSALHPDGIHLHSLLFKRKVKSNPKTSILVWMLTAPFIFLPLGYKGNEKWLILTILLFVVGYNWLYHALVNFKVRQKRRAKKRA